MVRHIVTSLLHAMQCIWPHLVVLVATVRLQCSQTRCMSSMVIDMTHPFTVCSKGMRISNAQLIAPQTVCNGTQTACVSDTALCGVSELFTAMT